jgi:predicted short-subunit dehydrogenase-like oxidoreductase (DUF2520 family)
MIPNITIIGTGRVAWQLGKRLVAKGLPVHQVVGRTTSHAKTLGEALGVSWANEWSAILPTTGWLLIAVRDDAIEAVARSLAALAPDALVTHTSGATTGAVLGQHFKRAGVFYPLQSFSMEQSPAWSKVPFCVDAGAESDIRILEITARKLGCRVYRVTDDQRMHLHVAAVFANNFTNHCFTIADKILKDHELPFEMLHPLMEATLSKAIHNPPALMQTGPAIRGDQETIRRHLHLLEDHPLWQQIYQDLSDSIDKDRTDNA